MVSKVKPQFRIEEGVCYCFFAYEVGQAIDLKAIDEHIQLYKERFAIRKIKKAPRYFEFEPAPIRVHQESFPVSIGAFETQSVVETVIYDFGAISQSYRIPIRGTLDELKKLSDQLFLNDALANSSQKNLKLLWEAIKPAIIKANLPDFVEDYRLFQIKKFESNLNLQEISKVFSDDFAQILRSESQALSPQEIEDALTHRVSYSPDDLLIVDWDSAIAFDPESEDVRAVVEFANVELLEMRFLDSQLDKSLDEAYEIFAKRQRGFFSPGVSQVEMRRIARMQVDSAILFEGVNNALKLLGDQYLARVYRLLSTRFHLNDWDASILRKLNTLESIYEKISDKKATLRAELLEWIIIVLIAISIAIPFLQGVPKK